MSPGRRIPRYALRSQQDIPVRDANIKISEPKGNAALNAQNPQAVPTAGSTIIHTKQPTVTTQLASENKTMSQNSESDQNVTCKRRKATRGMGTSKIAKAASTGKLSVVFDANCRQPICANAERFNNEIGFIIRNHCTFSYKDWRLVPEEVRAPLRSYLLENFDIDLNDETTKECIDDQMRKAWKGFKYKLHLYFKQIGGENNIEMAKKKRHPDLKDDQQKDWELLCDRWCSEHFKERAEKNSHNRSKRKWGSKNGSVSTARHHIRRGMALTSTTGQIETWRLQHYDKKDGWIAPELKDIYGDMMSLRETYTPEEMSDKKIMECVLGHHSVYLRGWGRSTDTINKASHRVSAEPNQPSYQELLQQFNDASTRLDEVFNILRQNNLMPQTSATNDASDAARSTSLE